MTETPRPVPAPPGTVPRGDGTPGNGAAGNGSAGTSAEDLAAALSRLDDLDAAQVHEHPDAYAAADAALRARLTAADR